MSEEEKGFTVKDRRAFDQEGQPRKEAEDKAESQPKAAPEQTGGEAASAQATEKRADQKESKARPLPPVEFNSLIISLAHAAMVHLGAIPDPASGQPQPKLEVARHTIDTIAMLKEKTQGNLSNEEQQLIDNTLTELRLAYVRLTAGN